MGVVIIENQKDFEDALKLPGVLVVHFYAEWAEPCTIMNNALNVFSCDPEVLNISFARVLAESFPELAAKYEINLVPTFVFFRNGEVIDRVEGANFSELSKRITGQIDSGDPVRHEPKPKRDLNSRIKELINSHKTILFMKGSPQDPKCGFSRQIITLLNDVVKDLHTFDILTDNELREGLKTYSNWPTYPQLYVHGELVGGLDVVRDMITSGDFQIMLNKHLESRLKSLINQADVMLFMKGESNAPKCGFSKQIIDILNETGIPFDTFDILKDEEVRSGLKSFSNWPTYPQVYVKGNLIGGIDIINEMKASNTLVDALQPHA